ncbi:uncharacterized protein LOC116166609 isoform X2 [Photinus pyralis]|uniref:uncharacterized protein LOC116166609 isoform X2 n=1 Tax=Photinus pyralis TaxID=7054 RepID=UPI0012673E8B|nr:uncharacterized protein LOC116166609 isoform X2 [Photinus pyralis]
MFLFVQNCANLTGLIVDFTLVTPIATTAFFNKKKPDHLNLDNLRRLTVGGNHSTKDHILKLRELFPKTVVCQSYGQSEVFARIAEFPEGERGQSLMNNFPDSIGLLRRAFDWKVVNVETEEILGPHQEGELRLKTNYLMREYLNSEPHGLYDSDGCWQSHRKF